MKLEEAKQILDEYGMTYYKMDEDLRNELTTGAVGLIALGMLNLAGCISNNDTPASRAAERADKIIEETDNVSAFSQYNDAYNPAVKCIYAAVVKYSTDHDCNVYESARRMAYKLKKMKYGLEKITSVVETKVGGEQAVIIHFTKNSGNGQAKEFVVTIPMDAGYVDATYDSGDDNVTSLAVTDIDNYKLEAAKRILKLAGYLCEKVY